MTQNPEEIRYRKVVYDDTTYFRLLFLHHLYHDFFRFLIR